MSILTTILAGGATGIFGTFISKLFGVFDIWQNRINHRDDMQHEITLLKMQIDAKAAESEQESLIAQSKDASDIRVASYQHDSSYGTASQWVINILRFIRPILTLFLLVAIFYIWSTGHKTLMTQGMILEFLTYASMTAITWWFGDRSLNRYPNVRVAS